MEFTHKYTRQAGFDNPRAIIKENFLRFVTQNAAGLEAFCRTGAPFGGNALIAGQSAIAAKLTQTPQEELITIQRQLFALTDQVAELTHKLDKTRAAVADQQREMNREPAGQIGIHRFWALQEKPHSLA